MYFLSITVNLHLFVKYFVLEGPTQGGESEPGLAVAGPKSCDR